MNNEMNAITSFQVSKTIPLEVVRADTETYPRLHQCKEGYNHLMMMRTIYMAHMYAGKSVDEENLKFMAGALLVELNENDFGTKNLTWYEIQRAVRKAILGQAKDKIFTISVASLYNCIVDYIKNEGKFIDEKVKRSKQKAGDQVPSKIKELYDKLKTEKDESRLPKENSKSLPRD